MQGEPPVQLMEMLKALEQNDLKTVSELQIQLWVDGGFRQPEHVNSHVRKLAAEMNKIAVEKGTWAIADAVARASGTGLRAETPPAAFSGYPYHVYAQDGGDFATALWNDVIDARRHRALADEAARKALKPVSRKALKNAARKAARR